MSIKKIDCVVFILDVSALVCSLLNVRNLNRQKNEIKFLKLQNQNLTKENQLLTNQNKNCSRILKSRLPIIK